MNRRRRKTKHRNANIRLYVEQKRIEHQLEMDRYDRETNEFIMDVLCDKADLKYRTFNNGGQK